MQKTKTGSTHAAIITSELPWSAKLWKHPTLFLCKFTYLKLAIVTELNFYNYHAFVQPRMIAAFNWQHYEHTFGHLSWLNNVVLFLRLIFLFF